ncbi:hypothetical protein HNP38_002706 [Chryseobacterium defluvii]|uniref:Uncharacterized protein n=1 Tax=Chryseobacterium defluvii TaxID=160396 RepID=A0A840KKK7_9FLAO|nr:hypothetical protein [Chryseobacterium defluvii]MBB4807402.1 hypothetical protein [Chryseobacterium defluvii]
MSTNNLNTNNNASQTLFRFATSRNAELSDPKNKERRFIFRDYETLRGVFDAQLNSSTTLQKLCENPSALPLTVETETTLKEKDSKFYDLAVWVARNKATATKEEFDAKIKEYEDYLAATKKAMLLIDSTLWDNLIYQVVTQKDFYAKETLMQFLHLNHILTVYTDGDEEVYNDVIKAKVVLPKELFKAVNESSAASGTASKTAQSTPKVLYNDKSMKFAEATIQLQENQNLSAALEKLEKSYRKESQQAQKEALKDYEREVKPARKEYQTRLAEIEYQKKLIIEAGNKEELTKLPYIPAPELPEFEFEFKPEIQPEELLRSLNEENISALSRILGTSEPGSALSDISSFADLSQSIEQNSLVLQQTVLNNTSLNQQVSTTVGGVVIPVANTLNSNGWIPFSVKTYSRGTSDWFIMLTIENYTHNIVSGSYKVTINGVEIASTNVFQAVSGVNFLFYNGTGIPASQTSNTGGFILQGDVVLDDGKTYKMDVTLIRDNSDIDRVLKQGVFKGSAAFTPVQKPVDPENPGNPENPTVTPTGAFIPSGFGMKNIGITDYKKVEQSTYCYVEGDVAHIENIMAREYKERATRRLKRNESQTTKSSESEKEKLTDTTSTERHEMQSEVAKILQESRDFGVQAGFYAKWGTSPAEYGLNVSANYATHNSKEESNRQAVTEAKDITARALDRIVTKVKEERIDKILEEYEENNKHGFDNTKGSSHVVGVYRWVDKVVKNQIYNYGKRMMFEFMVPEPAKLHSLGMKISKNTENQLIKPVDPRESTIHKLENFVSLDGASGETILKYWLGRYNVEIDEKPSARFNVSKGFHGNFTSPGYFTTGSDNIVIPEGYEVHTAKASVAFDFHPDGMEGSGVSVCIGNKYYNRQWERHFNQQDIAFNGLGGIRDNMAVSYKAFDCGTFALTVSAECTPTTEFKNAWLQKAFNKIIEAYQAELSKYEQALADVKTMGVQIKGSNPGFYRKIENTILRRNCISYMLEQNPGVDLTFGKDRYYTHDGSQEETFLNTDIKVDGKLDQYAAFVKFMEQAFEWEIMSYYFYPYYWGERKYWADLYQFDDNDPTFRAFMQSGMARVIVTVRPGFEEAVRHFLSTGQIWNGGEVPVIDDPLFLSIVDEMRSPKATKEGEPWREKIPTSLTILQADSIGLKVEKALPCNCEPGVKFDDNLGEMCGSNFELNENQIGKSGDKWIKISFNEMDQLAGFKTIENADNADFFPKIYECLGNTITVERDAIWLKTDPIIKMYKALADEVSQIEGVEAYPTGENGITFKINVSKIQSFVFKKGFFGEPLDVLRFTVDTENGYLKIYSPEFDTYGERILDKDGQKLTLSDFTDKALLSKFLV